VKDQPEQRGSMEQKSYNDGGVIDSSCGIVNCNANNKNAPLTYTVYAILALIVLVSAVIIADAAVNANKVRHGVNVVGTEASGKNRAELVGSLNNMEARMRENTIKIVYRKKSWNVNAEDFDIRIDKNTTVKKAMAYGRSGSTLSRIKTRIGLWFNHVTLKPAIKTDRNKMDALITGIGKSIDKIPEDAAIKIVEGRAVSTNSKNGLAVNKKALTQMIVDGVMYKKKMIDLPVIVVRPDIEEENLEPTLIEVKQMVKEPIVLKYREDSWNMSTDDLTGWIEFEKVRNGDRWNLEAKFDKDQISAFIEQSAKKIVTEPKDAEFKIEGDKVTVVPGSNGTKVDLDKAYEDITNVCISDADREVMLATETSEPKLTTEDANKMGIRDKVSGFSTTFSSKQTSRVHNIRTLAAALDGSILAPDQTFSFNDTIGPRTAAKGYKEAPAIVNGELVPSLGGGVCQVATTLFNTIFFGGFEVVERHNHSFFISHYPTGRDATVAWGGPDLRFKNDSDSYLLIKAGTTPGSITINFYGTKRNLKVDYKTVGPNNYRPSTVQTVKDPGLPEGVKKVVDKGFSGRDVTVYRTVTIDGVVYKKNTFTSKYNPKKTVVHLGTGPDPKKPAEEAGDAGEAVDTQKPQESTAEEQTIPTHPEDAPGTQQ
jgi:vancomycin resistance protein YoaR